jgi:hypothetical protein
MKKIVIVLVLLIMIYLISFFITNSWFSTFVEVSRKIEINNEIVKFEFSNYGTTYLWTHDNKYSVSPCNELTTNMSFDGIIEIGDTINKVIDLDLLIVRSKKQEYKFLLIPYK